jgi:hypothetical protein
MPFVWLIENLYVKMLGTRERPVVICGSIKKDLYKKQACQAMNVHKSRDRDKVPTLKGAKL